MLLSIRVADGSIPPRDIDVSPFVIGREADCDLVLDDPRASRRHAQIEAQPDGRVVLRDLGSANGTFVDDRRIEGGVWFTVPGSFRVGRTILDVRRVSDAGATLIVPSDSDATIVLAAPAAAAAVVATAPPPPVPYATPAAPAAPYAVAAAANAAPPPAVLWAAPAETAGPSMFRSSRTRALVTMAAIALAAILELVSIVHLAGFGQLADDVVNGVAGVPEAEAFDATTAQIGAVYLLVLIIGGIAFVAWLSRAVENAPAIGAGTPPHSPRGAIGWWFVPIANFVVPYQIVADLHDRLATAIDADRARPLLLGWWLTWLAGSVIGYGTLFTGTDTIDQAKSTISVTMASDAVTVVSAILAILVVRRIAAREDARATAAIQAGTGAPGV